MDSIPNKRLESIQKRINQYGIRFPVATLAKEGNFNKGYVSAALAGKKPISDNFWETFNKLYPEKEERSFLRSGPVVDSEEAVAARQYIYNNPLPGNATFQDHINLYERWLADREVKYQDAKADKAALIAVINEYLKAIPNLMLGQQQMKEQQYADTEHIIQLLEGLKQQLSAQAVPVEKDKAVGGRKANIADKSKVR